MCWMIFCISLFAAGLYIGEKLGEENGRQDNKSK